MAAENYLQRFQEEFPSLVRFMKPIDLDATRVPDALRDYVTYAQVWGIVDDGEREILVEQAPEPARRELREVLEKIDDELDKWLGGSEADSDSPTPEYLAFSAMRMAGDYLP